MKTNKELTPKDGVVYVYYPLNKQKVVALGRIGEQTFATQLPVYNTREQLQHIIISCMNSMSVYKETGKAPQDLNRDELPNKCEKFPIKEEINEEMFLAATTWHT